MSARAFRLLCVMSVLLAATAALAQEGHPAKGTWVGHWGPTLTVPSRIVLVIDHDGVTPLATIAAHIRHAHHDGAWDRAGITSSLANASAFAVGYAERSSLASVAPIFGAVDDTSLLIRATRYGDADLSGTVNLTDFNALAANFGLSDRVWSEGDFNYDRTVNLSDFNLLAGNFGLSVAGSAVTPPDWSALASAVPEPTSAVLFTALSASIARRRRD